jgi:integrase
VGDVKTGGSRRLMTLDQELMAVLRSWKQTSQFSAEEDWTFASPWKLGRLPCSYTGFWRELQRAAAESGVGPLGTHAFRHTYRSWLDAVGTPIAVQQKLMRHSDIRTTMNTYGSVVSDEMEKANFRVVGLALKPSTDLRVICVAVSHWKNGSSGRIRTYNPPVNSRMLCH